MKAVFADTLYWVSLANPRDSWRSTAQAARASLGDVQIYTTDEVLSEVLTAMSSAGPILRASAVKLVRAILSNPHITVVAQSRGTFIEAVNRYARRPDKSYSLADCCSMNAMDSLKIRMVLTNDRHFEQEGYEVLMKR